MKIELEQGWYADTEKKIIFREITAIKKIFVFFGWEKTEIVIIYSIWIRAMNTHTELTKFSPAFEHDNFLKPEKYPFYYRLNGGWKIKVGHEKYLKNGPLFSEDGTKVIIPEMITWRLAIEKFRWIGVLGGILSFVFYLKKFLNL